MKAFPPALGPGRERIKGRTGWPQQVWALELNSEPGLRRDPARFARPAGPQEKAEANGWLWMPGSWQDIPPWPPLRAGRSPAAATHFNRTCNVI